MHEISDAYFKARYKYLKRVINDDLLQYAKTGLDVYQCPNLSLDNSSMNLKLAEKLVNHYRKKGFNVIMGTDDKGFVKIYIDLK